MLQGEVEFRSILFVPPMSPMGKEDIVNPKTKNIRLYVKRVFISDDFDGELVCQNCLFLIYISFFFLPVEQLSKLKTTFCFVVSKIP